MLKKHLIAIGILLSLILLVIATRYYPGGSPFDKTAVGFSWSQNYISNLFEKMAWNGTENSARYWAVTSMVFLSLSFSVFFVQFAKRIPNKGAANVIKFLGGAGMICTFLIATPLHDLMVTIASTIFLICIFYITVFVFKSKLNGFKVFCTLYMLLFYATLYIYGSGDVREYLPIIQKTLFAATILIILSLHYFTKEEDFRNRQS